MRIIYECENLAILEDNEKFIVHILDNYRMVKELITNKTSLLSTLKQENVVMKEEARTNHKLINKRK